MTDVIAPKNWPEGFVYARKCVSTQLHPSLLEEFIKTGREEDREVTSPLIERGLIHSHISLVKITHSMKHPLSHSTYGKRAHYGLFASAAIDSEVELGEYVGELQVMAANWKHNFKDFDHAWTLEQGPFLFVLNAKKVANELAFVNDYRGLGKEPNVKPKWVVHRGQYHLVFETIKRVHAKEELLIDYGEGYWKASSRSSLIPKEG